MRSAAKGSCDCRSNFVDSLIPEAASELVPRLPFGADRERRSVLDVAYRNPPVDPTARATHTEGRLHPAGRSTRLVLYREHGGHVRAGPQRGSAHALISAPTSPPIDRTVPSTSDVDTGTAAPANARPPDRRQLS